MTLKQYIKKCGSQEKAASDLGITFSTLNRWLNQGIKPSSLALLRLESKGITL